MPYIDGTDEIKNQKLLDVISEEPILDSYPEFIKELEKKRLNARKAKNSMLVYEKQIIRRMMSNPEGHGKPFLENLYKYKRSNKSAVVIGNENVFIDEGYVPGHGEILDEKMRDFRRKTNVIVTGRLGEGRKVTISKEDLQ